MIYVKDRSADSICDTALEFFVMKSEYIPSHFGGMDRTAVVRSVACLYMAATAKTKIPGLQGPTWVQGGWGWWSVSWGPHEVTSTAATLPRSDRQQRT
jgi:hypothetical protein